MLAARLHHRGGPDDVLIEEVAVPVPGAGEALVAMRAAGVTGDEFNWSTAWVDARGRQRLPVTPGHELSGVVAEAGSGVRRFAPGDEVFGIPDFFRDGAVAEYVVVPQDLIAAKPPNVPHDAAAVLALSGLTAWQALFVEGDLHAGEHVLVHAAAGAIGHLAVQLAHSAGARVTATASKHSIQFVRGLGADRVIDYRTTRFDEVLADVDLVLDTIGGDTLARSLVVLGEAGRLISLAPAGRGANRADPRARFVLVSPNAVQLEHLAALVASDELRPHIHARFPLSGARAAYQAATAGGVRGKIVVLNSAEDLVSP